MELPGFADESGLTADDAVVYSDSHNRCYRMYAGFKMGKRMGRNDTAM